MEDQRLIEYSRRESPADKSHFFWEVAFPTLFTAATSGAAGWLISVEAAAVAALVLGGGVLIWRLIQWDTYAHGVHIVERKIYREEGEPRREWAPVIRDRGDDGNGNHRWRISSWYFSESEWRALWSVLKDGVVTRDGLATVTLDNGNRMFPNITSRYSEYLSRLQQIGWADDDNRVTAAAHAWFEERDIAPPPA